MKPFRTADYMATQMLRQGDAEVLTLYSPTKLGMMMLNNGAGGGSTMMKPFTAGLTRGTVTQVGWGVRRDDPDRMFRADWHSVPVDDLTRERDLWWRNRACHSRHSKFSAFSASPWPL